MLQDKRDDGPFWKIGRKTVIINLQSFFHRNWEYFSIPVNEKFKKSAPCGIRRWKIGDFQRLETPAMAVICFKIQLTSFGTQRTCKSSDTATSDFQDQGSNPWNWASIIEL
jgi:hypothetical protein